MQRETRIQTESLTCFSFHMFAWVTSTHKRGAKPLKCVSLSDEQQYEYGEDLGITAVALYDYQAGEDSHQNISSCSDPEICRHQKHHVEICNISERRCLFYLRSADHTVQTRSVWENPIVLKCITKSHESVLAAHWSDVCHHKDCKQKQMHYFCGEL